MPSGYPDTYEGYDYASQGPSGAQTAPSTSVQPLSVSQALQKARGALYAVGSIVLVAEVSKVSSNPNYSAVYFDVKDAEATMSCKMWRNRYLENGIELHVGMKVQLTGRFDIYAKKGTFTFDVVKIEHQGEGELRAQVHRLAEKLRKEGLMAPERKRPLPLYPQRIGLVTSPAGAAVHDVLRTLRRRFPMASVVFIGVQVEGDQAAAGMAAALRAVAERDVEVILLVRGGGSFENLMPFNDEALARTIAAMPVPVVTGIGHENDNTIADLVADHRASTPTGAAQAVSPVADDLLVFLDAQQDDLTETLSARIETNREKLSDIANRPMFKRPASMYEADEQRLDSYAKRVSIALPTMLDAAKQSLAALETRPVVRDPKRMVTAERASLDLYGDRLRAHGPRMTERFGSDLAHTAARLNDLSPLAVVGRGYAIARDASGRIIRTAASVGKGDSIDIQVADGRIAATVTSALLDKDPSERSSES